jgi:hypothetical protein
VIPVAIVTGWCTEIAAFDQCAAVDTAFELSELIGRQRRAI